MHQTFYIDIDEEITSIVDRLRKARAKEVIVVVPKRALLVQSIVNLKLLKKESDKLGKQLSIVTQDKLGKMLIEKVGINVQDKLDDIDGDEVTADDAETDEHVFVADAEYDLQKNDSKSRLDGLGSDTYFKEEMEDGGYVEKISKFKDFESTEKNTPLKSSMGLLPDTSDEIEKIINKELVTEIGADIESVAKTKKSQTIRPGKPTFDIVRNANAENDVTESIEVKKNMFEQQSAFSYDDYEKLTLEDESRRKEAIRSQNNRVGNFQGEDVVNNFFQSKDASNRGNAFENKKQGEIELSHGLWKFFAVVGVLVIVVLAGVGGYIFLPKADIKIALKNKEQSFDAQVRGEVVAGTADSIVTKLISIEDTFSGKYPATGSKASITQKAKGMITIYNEYSNSSQPLIASTRFETTDGKIFRLTKGVTVPGTSNSNGETKPGVIEAEVVADSAGSEYNIDASTFSIPGFKDSGTEKYTKIYAKSSKSMLGGGNNGSIAESISSGDIANAKNKALAELTKSLKDKIKNSSSGDGVVLDDAVDIGEVVYDVSNLEGEVVSEFTVTAKARANAVVFNKSDLQEILEKKALADGNSDSNFDESSLVLQYGKSDVDFAKGSILIRVHVSGKISSKVDAENLKKGVLGKSEEDFKAYIKTYPEIDSVEINYWPAFISGKIPAYENKINITLDNK